MRVSKQLSASELLSLINKQWATALDIKKIACCGNDKASKIKKEILQDLEAKNYYVPTGLVPMEAVINYLKINISYLKKMSKIERSVKEDEK